MPRSVARKRQPFRMCRWTGTECRFASAALDIVPTRVRQNGSSPYPISGVFFLLLLHSSSRPSGPNWLSARKMGRRRWPARQAGGWPKAGGGRKKKEILSGDSAPNLDIWPRSPPALRPRRRARSPWRWPRGPNVAPAAGDRWEVRAGWQARIAGSKVRPASPPPNPLPEGEGAGRPHFAKVRRGVTIAEPPLANSYQLQRDLP